MISMIICCARRICTWVRGLIILIILLSPSIVDNIKVIMKIIPINILNSHLGFICVCTLDVDLTKSFLFMIISILRLLLRGLNILKLDFILFVLIISNEHSFSKFSLFLFPLSLDL